MNLAASIAPHLPFLRRYARALTGSQKAGDAYVRATLEAILAQKDAMGEEGSPRVRLYRLFHAIWSGTELPRPEGIAPATPDERLQALRPSNREALLLAAVEGFNRADIATILGKDDAQVEEEIAEAQASIEQELASRVLIIEDESIIALDLENMMVELGHEVVGIAATR
jgi:DNA-directed RNA polymerase specialized sigma24 family protein